MSKLKLRLQSLILALALCVAGLSPAIASSFCPSAAHAKELATPAGLLTAVSKTFEIDAGAAKDATYVRCVGSTLIACYVGANLDCGKADLRRTSPGATAWCRSNPGSTIVPMVATGHDTIYAWSCKGRKALAGRKVLRVDAQGYLAENWKPVR